MNKQLKLAVMAAVAGASIMAATGAYAACTDISRGAVEDAAAFAASQYDATNDITGGYHGLGLPMWVTVVDETGKVCHVVNSNGEGDNSHDAWLGSRVISAQKANTANAFSTDDVAISTAMLYGVTQPGGSLYGLQHSNPIDASKAYGGSPNSYGKVSDFLKNKRIGGVNVFGGGLALYKNGVKVGAVGVSGDTSCADHAFAWLVRQDLGMTGGGTDVLTLSDDPTGNFQHARCNAGERDGDAGTTEVVLVF